MLKIVNNFGDRKFEYKFIEIIKIIQLTLDFSNLYFKFIFQMNINDINGFWHNLFSIIKNFSRQFPIKSKTVQNSSVN